MSSAAIRKGRPNPVARYAAVVAFALVAGGVAGAISYMLGDVDGLAGTIATAGIVTVAMAAAFAVSIWWWRRVDEAAREAHKWAWWWGGTAGMAIGGVVLLTIVTRGTEGTVLAEMSATSLIYAGAMGLAGFQLAGYSVAWAAWWLQRR